MVSTAVDIHPKRAIIIGASSGMGKAVAQGLANDGYIVGLAARRIDLLRALQQTIITESYIKQMDVSQPHEAVERLQELIAQMGGLDLLVIASSGFRDVAFSDRDWNNDRAILDVDVIGFYALARTGCNYFEQQGYGHLVGFSSIDGLRGIAFAAAYSAAKSFCSRYLEAERNYFMQKNIPVVVTEIIPGWINSQEDPDFKEHYPQAYWFETLDDAAQEIMQAIRNKVPVAYITKRWQTVAQMLNIMPDDLYNAIGGL